MISKHTAFWSLCIVLALAAVSCTKNNKTPETPNEENGFNGGFGYVGGYSSHNVEFEQDWASQTGIQSVIGNTVPRYH